MPYIETITFDLDKKSPINPIKLRRGENGLTNIVGKFISNGTAYNLQGCSVYFCSLNALKQFAKHQATITNSSDGTATYTLASDTTSVPGELLAAYFEIRNGDKIITTGNIPIIICDNVEISDEQASQYKSTLDQMLDEIEGYLSSVQSITDAAAKATSSANTAASNASSATTKANNAAASATSASTSANSAATAANTAAEKANKAMETFNSLTKTEITYQVGTSSSVPTGSWSTSRPTVAQGSTLWTKVVNTYSNGNTDTMYFPSYQGIDGDVKSENQITDLDTRLKSLQTAWDSASSTIFRGTKISEDLNDVDSGVYTFIASTKNAPCENGMVLCICNSTSARIHQLAFSLNATALYQRSYHTEWKDWRQL